MHPSSSVWHRPPGIRGDSQWLRFRANKYASSILPSIITIVISSHCHVATAKCVLTELQVVLQGMLMSNGKHVEPDDPIAHLLTGPNAERRRTRQMPMKEKTVEKTEDTTEKKTDEKTKVLVLTETWRMKFEEDALQFRIDEAIKQ